MKYYTYSYIKKQLAAIKRVRHLAESFASGSSDKVTYSGKLVANEILKALDGDE